jgi:RNA polymerase sigma-70 factor (ECF subfamily)
MGSGQIEKSGALGEELAKVRFGKLYREQARAILAYALRRTETPEDASDVVAETFLVAWRRLDEVPLGRGERLWLYAVARRVTANVRRAEGRRTRLSERLAEMLPDELAVQPQSDGEASEVLRAMAGLGDEERELLLLDTWDELSPSEAARVLGLTQIAARSRLHRARRRLRALLEEQESAGRRSPRPQTEEAR